MSSGPVKFRLPARYEVQILKREWQERGWWERGRGIDTEISHPHLCKAEPTMLSYESSYHVVGRVSGAVGIRSKAPSLASSKSIRSSPTLAIMRAPNRTQILVRCRFGLLKCLP